MYITTLSYHNLYLILLDNLKKKTFSSNEKYTYISANGGKNFLLKLYRISGCHNILYVEVFAYYLYKLISCFQADELINLAETQPTNKLYITLVQLLKGFPSAIKSSQVFIYFKSM